MHAGYAAAHAAAGLARPGGAAPNAPPAAPAAQPPSAYQQLLEKQVNAVGTAGKLHHTIVHDFATKGAAHVARLLQRPEFKKAQSQLFKTYDSMQQQQRAQQQAAGANGMAGAGAARAGMPIPVFPGAGIHPMPGVNGGIPPMPGVNPGTGTTAAYMAFQAQVQANQRAHAEMARKLAVEKAAEKENQLEEEEDDEEHLDHSHVYAQYRPAKVTDGGDHPDPIVESQSLASVVPPDPTYKHHLQEDVEARRLSNAQVETVIYACMRFNQTLPTGERAGFFLGDGAGVGKGRQIAALIKEFWSQGGRRILWVSTSRDLAYDARRDLKDMHAPYVDVHPKGKDTPPQGDLAKAFPEGVLFITYSLLTVKGKGAGGKIDVPLPDDLGEDEPDDVAPYGGRINTNTKADKAKKAAKQKAELRTKKMAGLAHKESRLSQICDWLSYGKSKDNDPKAGENCLIILDECHRAKNLLDSNGNSTMTGLAVESLQDRLRQARVLYSSATGASEPQNMLYMKRVGSYGYKDMHEMVAALKKSGLGGVEMFAMGLKATGAYLSRTLSYKDAEFRLEQVDIAPAFKVLYDRSVMFWNLLNNLMKELPKPQGRDIRGGLFWSAHQRFYKCLLIAAKVKRCSELAHQALKNDMCIVIGLQSTGEANMTAARELDGDEQDDLVSAPRMVLQQFVSKHLFRGVVNMADQDMKVLLAKVYNAAVLWRKLKPIDQEAVENLKREDNIKRRQDKARAQQARAAAERAAREEREEQRRAGQAVGGGQAAEQGPESDGDDVMEIGERGLDEVLQARNQAAVLSGNFIDLTDDGKVTDTLDKMEVEERLLLKQQEETKFKEAEQRIMDRLAEAQAEMTRLQAVASGVTPAKDTSKAEAIASKQETAILELEDDEPERAPATKRKASASGGPSKKKQAGRSRVIDSEHEEEEEEEEPDVDSDDIASPPGFPAKGRSRRAAAVKAQAKSTKMLNAERKAAVITSDEDSEEEEQEDEEGEEEEEQGSGKEEEEKDSPVPVVKRKPVVGSGWIKKEKRGQDDGAGPSTTAKKADKPESSFFKPRNGTNNQAGTVVQRLRIQKAQETVTSIQRELDSLRADRKRQLAEQERQDRQGLRAPVGAAGPSKSALDEDDDEDMPQYRMTTKNKPLPGAAGSSGAQKGKGKGKAGKRNGKAKGGKRRRRGGSDDDDDDFDSEGFVQSEAEESGLEDLDEEAAAGADAQAQELPPTLRKMRAMLLRLVEALELPPNPLDQLTELMGGEDKVAEMTGRKGMLVRNKDGKVEFKQRRMEEAQKMVNLAEKDDFMSGKKLVAIISDAASTGISLQADKRAKNQRRRYHITLELPWSADRAIQQFGRSHRSGQASAPIYCLLVSKCGGEYRFAGAMAKRLASLGALLQGDQRALGAAANLKAYDVDTPWAGEALAQVYDFIASGEALMPGVRLPPIPESYFPSNDIAAAGGLVENLDIEQRERTYIEAMQQALCSVGLGKAPLVSWAAKGCEVDPKFAKDVPRFLNRLLGMSLETQDLLFTLFSDVLSAVIKAAKSEGKYQEGVEVLTGSIVTIDQKKKIHVDKTTAATSYYVKLKIDDGLSWESALAERDAARQAMMAEGATREQALKCTFYIAKTDWKAYHKPHVILGTEIIKRSQNDHVTWFRMRRPYQNAGSLVRYSDLTEKYKMAKDDQAAKDLWEWWHATLFDKCLHGPNCAKRLSKQACYMGSRVYYKHIITGALLPVLHKLFEVVENSPYGRDSNNNRKRPPRALRAKVLTSQAAIAAATAGSAGGRALPSIAAAPADWAGGSAGPSRPSLLEPASTPSQAAGGTADLIDLTLDSDDDEVIVSEPPKPAVMLTPPRPSVVAAAVAGGSVGRASGGRKGLVGGAAPAADDGIELMVGFNLIDPDVDLFLTEIELGGGL